MPNNDFDLFLTVNEVKVSQLEKNSNSICGAAYCTYIYIYQVSNRYVKTCRKSPKKLKNSRTHRNNGQNSEYRTFAKNGTYVKQYTVGYRCTKFEGYILIYEVAYGGFHDSVSLET